MKKEKLKLDEATVLRRKAENLLKAKKTKESLLLSDLDTVKLLHELEVHQIELEMQNEELQAAIAKSEINADKYTNLYDFAPAGYITLDSYGRIFELNLNAASMLGKERLNLIKNNFNLFISPETRTTFNDFFKNIYRTNNTQVCEVQLYFKEIPTLYIHLEGIASDKNNHCFLTLINISNRKNAEAALIKSKEEAERNEEELNKAQKIAHLGSWHLDLATNQVVWTKELYKMYGLDPNQPIPSYPEQEKLFTAASWELLTNSIEKITQSGIPYELELETLRENKKNGWMWVRGETVVDIEGNIVGLWGAAQDISVHKHAEETIRESSRLNKTLLQTIPFGINIVDEDGNILFMSDNLKNIFGEEAIGKKCWKIYRDDKTQCIDCPLVLGIKIGETSTYETKGVFGGKTFEISHTGMLFQNKKAILEIFKDITLRKKQEAQLILAKNHAEESDRLKSAFLANMSHEIRTPMNGILGFAQLLKEPDISGEEQESYIHIIEKSGDRMLNIINDIVNISKIEAGLMEVCHQETNLNTMLEYIYTFFKPEAKALGRQISYKNSLPDKKAYLNTDREKLYSIFTNLVKNAIKYAESGSVDMGYIKKGDFFEFYVKDTGVGIPKERQDTIFERFIQGDNTDKKMVAGNGLGLSISKAYIEMQGGTIWLESEEGKGATFFFKLPIEAKKS